MTKTTAKLRNLDGKGLLVQPLSVEAEVQAQLIQRWRSHIAETQSFVRLAVAFLQANPNAERRAQVEQLFSTEARVIAMLPLIDLSELHSGHTPEQSGVTMLRPDGLRAGVFLRSLRERICARLRGLTKASETDSAFEPLVRAINAATTDLTHALDLLELLLFPRLTELSVDGAEALGRAAELVQRKVTIDCVVSIRVPQVRGLYRLLATLLDHCDEESTVRVNSDALRAVITMPMPKNRMADDRLYFIRFCAHLGKMTFDRDEDSVKLTMPLMIR